jgi:hypothetical protein
VIIDGRIVHAAPAAVLERGAPERVLAFLAGRAP